MTASVGRRIGRAGGRLLDPELRGVFLAVLVGAAAVAAVVVLPQTGSTTGLLDLRIYVGASGSIRDGASIYDFTDTTYGLGSTYPPLWSLLVLPLSFVDIHAVELLATFANAIAWFAVLWVAATPLRPLPMGGGVGADAAGVADAGADAGGAVGASGAGRRTPGQPWLVVLVWALSIASAPVWNTLNQGQINIVIWLLIVADVRRFLEQDRRAGTFVGIAAALKLHPAIAVVLMVLSGNWRAGIRAAVAFVVVTAVAALALWGDSFRYWTERIFDTSLIGSVADAQNNSVQGVLARAGVDGTARTIAWVGVSVLALVLGAYGFRLAARRRCEISALVVVGATTGLLLPISWTHHLVFLSLPLLLVAASNRLGLAVKVAVIVVVSVVLVDPVGFGRNGVTSDLRAGLMLALLAAVPLLVRAEEQIDADRDARPLAPDAAA